MNLLSIDMEKGRINAYTSVANNKPKRVQTIDIKGWDRNKFSFDVWELEAFRQNPNQYIAAHGDDAA